MAKMSVLDYLDSFAVPESEWDKELEWVNIFGNEQFLAKASISVISADTSSFKTYFTTEYALLALNSGKFKKVYNIDFDGDTRVYKHRKQNEIMKPLRNNKQWIQLRENEIIAKDMTIDTILDELSRKDENLDGVLFILDVLSNFTNPNDVKEVNKLFGILRRLANLNATIIVLHHNKKERTIDGQGQYSGVSYLTGKADVAYQLIADNTDKNNPTLTFQIIKSKYNYLNGDKYIIFNLNISETAGNRLSINKTKNYEEIKDGNDSKKQKIIQKILFALQEENEMPQGKLLEKIGISKDDKMAKGIIQGCAKYKKPLWYIREEKDGVIKRIFISLKPPEN